MKSPPGPCGITPEEFGELLGRAGAARGLVEAIIDAEHPQLAVAQREDARRDRQGAEQRVSSSARQVRSRHRRFGTARAGRLPETLGCRLHTNALTHEELIPGIWKS